METNQRIRQIIKSQTAPYPPQGVLWVHELEGKEVKEVWKNGQWAPVETISLEEIWDVLNNGGGATEPLEIATPEEEVSGTKAEAATALGITEQDFDNILSGKVISIKTTPPGSPSITMIVPLTGVATMDVPDVGTAVIARYNLMSVSGTSNSYIRIIRQGDEYTVSFTSEGGIIGG